MLVTSSQPTDIAHRLFVDGNKRRMDSLQCFPPTPYYRSATTNVKESEVNVNAA
ncbi:MAG TPA: hypothetical protein VHF65_09465 [Nitrososphaera sp.]|nr:hypothetical protein [Nitrososphaera sp.]